MINHAVTCWYCDTESQHQIPDSKRGLEVEIRCWYCDSVNVVELALLPPHDPARNCESCGREIGHAPGPHCDPCRLRSSLATRKARLAEEIRLKVAQGESHRLRDQLSLAEAEIASLKAQLALSQSRDIDLLANEGCRDLPRGFQIVIELEKDYGQVKLEQDDWSPVYFGFEGEPISEQIRDAIEAAKEGREE